jgi:hypothetical protein
MSIEQGVCPLDHQGKASPHASQRGIQRVGGRALHIRRDVAVAVERHRDVGMSQPFLVDRGMHSLSEQQRRTGKPQVMETQVRQDSLPDEALEAGYQHVAVQDLSGLRGKDVETI